MEILFIPLACAECDDSLPFSGASSIPLCYVPFPSTLFHQLVFHPSSVHLAICFLVYLSAWLLPNSYIILLWEFCFLPFFVHAQTNVIYSYLLEFGCFHPVVCVYNLLECAVYTQLRFVVYRWHILIKFNLFNIVHWLIFLFTLSACLYGVSIY